MKNQSVGALRQRGMSLIELVMGMVLLMVLLAMAAPGFSQWIGNSRVRNGAEGVLNGLQIARSEALSRNARVQLVLAADGGWSIGCVAASTECPATIQVRDGREGSGNLALAKLLADNSSTTGAASITFDSLGRRAGANPVVQVDVDSSTLAAAVSRELRVQISPGGRLRLCDPNFSITHPQGCRA